MVQVVLHKVVLGKVGDVGMLDVRNVRGGHKADIHGDCGRTGACCVVGMRKLLLMGDD